MSRFIAEADRSQGTLLPLSFDEYVAEESPVRGIDAFVDALDLADLGFAGVGPKATGRPTYHPATMIKIDLYGYLNRIQSTRRFEQEARRNLELMWLVGRLAPVSSVVRLEYGAERVQILLLRETIGMSRDVDFVPEVVGHRDFGAEGQERPRPIVVARVVLTRLPAYRRMAVKGRPCPVDVCHRVGYRTDPQALERPPSAVRGSCPRVDAGLPCIAIASHN